MRPAIAITTHLALLPPCAPARVPALRTTRRARTSRVVRTLAATRPTGPSLRRGGGILRFAEVDGATALVECAATTPLQILAPRRRGRSAWAVLASHGGGLVAGDSIHVDVTAAAGATAVISTQAETKVYRSPEGAAARHTLDVRAEDRAVVAVVPDPVSMFEGARYDQQQRVDLEPGASLLLIDSVVAGRSARGERWAFESYRSVNEVHAGSRLLFGDALALEPRWPGELAARLGRFEAFALLVAVGPAFSGCAHALSARVAASPVERDAPLLATASSFSGGLLVRCAAATTERLSLFMRQAIAPAGSALGDELANRW